MWLGLAVVFVSPPADSFPPFSTGTTFTSRLIKKKLKVSRRKSSLLYLPLLFLLSFCVVFFVYLLIILLGVCLITCN